MKTSIQQMKHRLILASNSPRRKVLLENAGFEFSVITNTTKEVYPGGSNPYEVPLYLARLKNIKNRPGRSPNTIVLTLDTVVILGLEILGKPKTLNEARNTLRKLSGKSHDVVTGVCIWGCDSEICFSTTSTVYFKKLEEEEIGFYVNKFKPLDKAGAYGIQEWIGSIGVRKIIGSYENVMGIPVFEIYERLIGLGLKPNI